MSEYPEDRDKILELIEEACDDVRMGKSSKGHDYANRYGLMAQAKALMALAIIFQKWDDEGIPVMILK